MNRRKKNLAAFFLPFFCPSFNPFQSKKSPLLFTLPFAMSTVEKPSQELDVEAKFKALQNHVANYRMAMNEEGVWLFLCALGCWSVTNTNLQFMAFLVAGLLFFDRTKRRFVETPRSFKKLVNELRDRISQSVPDGDFRKARLYDLSVFQKTELSTFNNIKKSWIFAICWFFWGFSFLFLMLLSK